MRSVLSSEVVGDVTSAVTSDVSSDAAAGTPEVEAPQVVVLDAGPLTTVQDEGRSGWAHLGVSGSGFLDRASARWANRLVANPEGAALLETTLGGAGFRVLVDTRVAVTGARAEVRVDGWAAPQDEAFTVPAGSALHIGAARSGVRSYVAFAGGVDVPPVLGSRSTDLLGGLGPSPLSPGQGLRLGVAPVPFRAARRGAAGGAAGRTVGTHGLLPRDVHGAVPVPPVWQLRVWAGPGAGWMDDVRVLDGVELVAGSGSNRVGLRLERPSRALSRRPGEMTSEPVVTGAVQLPPSLEPVVFLADHPTTGGYPVVAVVVDEDLDLCARVRPGERVRLRLVGP